MSRATYWLAPAAFPQNTMDYIQGIVEDRRDQEETAGLGTNNDGHQNSDVRRSRVIWLSDQQWLKDYLYDSWIMAANRESFNVDVLKCCDIQYTEYHASEQGHYDFHKDVFWEEEKQFDRKLSLTIQLSEPTDYEGGNFEFHSMYGHEMPVESKWYGSVLIFPSYMEHAVKPVTSGVRKSLVAWFEGPRWR